MDGMENNSFLGQEKVSSLMAKFAVPCVLSFMVSALYNIVDQIFIGNSELSTLGNAAIGVVFPVFILAQAFAWCSANGCATYMNICQGKKMTDVAHKAVGTCLTLTIAISFILMAVIFPFKVPFLQMFGASASNIDLAVEYLNLILGFMPTLILSNMVTTIITADGSPNFSMMALLAGAGVNIVFDPIFIFGLHWGMTGAGLATIMGQITSCVIAFVYFRKPKTFRLHRQSFVPDWHIFGEMIKLGFSTFVTQISVLIITVLCNVTLVKYGALSQYGVDIPIAVIGIATKVFTVLINIVVGMVLGCQPIISYNMGAEHYGRIKKLYKLMLICTIIVSLSFTLVFELAPHFIIGLFGVPTNIPNPEDYWIFAAKTFRIYLMLVTFCCIVKLNSIFLQSVGRPVYALISSVIRDLACFAPLLVLLPMKLGIEGVLVAAPISDAIAIVVATIFMVKFMKSLPKQSNALS